MEYSVPFHKTMIRGLAENFGVDRLEIRDIYDEALTIPRPDTRFTVFLKRDNPRLRHRFSLAHEVAHLLSIPLLGNRTTHRRSFDPLDPEGKRVEHLCDRMAASLLMPRERVLELISENNWSAKYIPTMTSNFDVSFEAAARRYLNLVPLPSAMLVWKPGQERRIEKLQKPSFNEALGPCWIDLKKPPSSSPLAVAGAMKSERLVSSLENVELRFGGPEGRYFNLPKTKVESLSQGNGQYKRLFSFIYIPMPVVESGRVSMSRRRRFHR